jgi:hypothetical protein
MTCRIVFADPESPSLPQVKIWNSTFHGPAAERAENREMAESLELITQSGARPDRAFDSKEAVRHRHPLSG